MAINPEKSLEVWWTLRPSEQQVYAWLSHHQAETLTQLDILQAIPLGKNTIVLALLELSKFCVSREVVSIRGVRFGHRYYCHLDLSSLVASPKPRKLDPADAI